MDLLVTLGSPLGPQRPIYRRLRPSAAFAPPVRRWVNIADPGDIVASARIAQPLFPSWYRDVDDRAVRDREWWRRGIDRYFAQPAVVDLVGGLFR